MACCRTKEDLTLFVFERNNAVAVGLQASNVIYLDDFSYEKNL